MSVSSVKHGCITVTRDKKGTTVKATGSAAQALFNAIEKEVMQPPRVARNCQSGGDACLAGQRDGICCPDDSCDIDDGVRHARK